MNAAVLGVTAVSLRVFPNIAVATHHGSAVLPVVMAAIGGAESTFGKFTAGPSAYVNCGGHGYYGVWQIALGAHAEFLRNAVGSDSVCEWATWLQRPLNNAYVAHAVYRSQGLAAWQTYQSGAYLSYMADAQSAYHTLVLAMKAKAGL